MSWLQSFQVFFDQVQTKDTLFKGIGQASEQRCFSTILEEVESGNNSVGFLSGPDIVDKHVQRQPAESRQVLQSFRKDACKEECVVAHVAPDLSLAIKRTPIQQRIGFQWHFGHIFQPPSLSIANLVEILNMGEPDQDLRDAPARLGILDARIAGEASRYQMPKQLTQRVI